MGDDKAAHWSCSPFVCMVVGGCSASLLRMLKSGWKSTLESSLLGTLFYCKSAWELMRSLCNRSRSADMFQGIMRYGGLSQNSASLELHALFAVCHAGPGTAPPALPKLELMFSCQIAGCRNSLTGNGPWYTRFTPYTPLLSCVSENAGLLRSHNAEKSLCLCSLACRVFDVVHLQSERGNAGK